MLKELNVESFPKIVKSILPPLVLGYNGVYDLEVDTITMANIIGGEAYQRVMIHELMHSTGHPLRNDRVMIGVTSSEVSTGILNPHYCIEEILSEVSTYHLLMMYSGISDKELNKLILNIKYFWLQIFGTPHKIKIEDIYKASSYYILDKDKEMCYDKLGENLFSLCRRVDGLHTILS